MKAVATIQIRDIPDDVHRTYKARAAAAGMSLQEYIRLELVEGASLQSPGELAREVAAEMRESIDGFSRVPAAPFIRAHRGDE